MPAQTYGSVAVASTFSPRFLQVMSEAKRVAHRFGSELKVIFVGEKSAETEDRFRQAFSELELPPSTPVIYVQGTPADAILRGSAENGFELLMAGALEREVVLHSFLGNVARRLVREATSSVLLFTEPSREPAALRRIVFMADFSEHGAAALKKTVALAEAEKSDRLYVTRVYTSFDRVRAALGEPPPESEDVTPSLESEEATLENFILETVGETEVPIEARFVRGNTGYAALDFVKNVEADLLVVPVAPTEAHGPGELPPRVAWITDVIPCNLWVIR